MRAKVEIEASIHIIFHCRAYRKRMTEKAVQNAMKETGKNVTRRHYHHGTNKPIVKAQTIVNRRKPDKRFSGTSKAAAPSFGKPSEAKIAERASLIVMVIPEETGDVETSSSDSNPNRKTPTPDAF